MFKAVLGIGFGLASVIVIAVVFVNMLEVPPASPNKTAPAVSEPRRSSENTEPVKEMAGGMGETISPQEEVQPEVRPDIQSPSIDEVRREGDGLTILAGRGAPDAIVQLFVNGAAVAETKIAADGTFVFITDLPLDGEGKILRVTQTLDAIEMAAEDVILAPVSPPLIEKQPQTSAPEQVEEARDVAVLKTQNDGVDVLSRSSPPDVMENIALDTISYSPKGDVLLGGRAHPEAQGVRVYLNNKPIKTLAIDTSGRWRGALPDVDTGIYTLRLDELNDQGAVSSRVETPFKREDPKLLAQTHALKPPLASDNEAQKKATDRVPPATSVKVVTVQSGSTLWAIAQERYGDGMLFVRVFEANADRIADADLIYPGQVFDLPE